MVLTKPVQSDKLIYGIKNCSIGTYCCKNSQKLKYQIFLRRIPVFITAMGHVVISSKTKLFALFYSPTCMNKHILCQFWLIKFLRDEILCMPKYARSIIATLGTGWPSQIIGSSSQIISWGHAVTLYSAWNWPTDQLAGRPTTGKV